MKYQKLGHSDLEVSSICLGTMTYGQQNTEKEAHEQLDFATSNGVNFIDTAELYAIPIQKETQGLTEQYIGTWLNKRAKRDDIILATKASGPGPSVGHIREMPNFSKQHINQAVNDSLTRLQTDYIDLYQLHWPERQTNFFGRLGYQHTDDSAITDFKATLEVLNELIQEGKIRHIGISNETPWGMMQYLKLAEIHNLPKVTSIQNPYSLINRTYEIGLSEMGLRENVGLLAYSPLGGGLLSGKYQGGKQPQDARYTLWPNYFARYNNEPTEKAVKLYTELAFDHNLNPTQMALAFVNSRDFVASNIIGATKMEQLKENIDSINMDLSDDLISEIEKIHLMFPNPAP